MTWRMDLIHDLDELKELLNQNTAPSVLEVKNRMRVIYNRLPAIIGTPGLNENDDVRYRLNELERKYELMFKDLYKFIIQH